MTHYKQQTIKKTISKDIVNKKLSGVCAGIAKYYQIPRLIIRLGAIIALLMLPVVTGVAYLLAALLMPNGEKNHQYL